MLPGTQLGLLHLEGVLKSLEVAVVVHIHRAVDLYPFAAGCVRAVAIRILLPQLQFLLDNRQIFIVNFVVAVLIEGGKVIQFEPPRGASSYPHSVV